MSSVRITTNASTTSGSIEIDGLDVSSWARGFSFSAAVGELPRLDLELVPRGVAEFEGDAFVSLNSDFVEFLVKLGWKPPYRP
ncbi:hypothetical protein GCM10010168_85990 [Actinoplanes ianthinogenes]|uniref:Uncharacterized protein n=1 Tax=Actinoplanes ianthinogenes TaxID=122358 RepID=A0ABM7M1E0_9ACTN|nr:hypothetical protein [Actinoplanes ianthinogenes]BCJ45330.1 hypothetical protein Aiant_59870 [Actinoplanes ianthinogenes]GGR53817.1 hypothetical protein GCM10010168_85990 [Actinoplanes ianthinogenes]